MLQSYKGKGRKHVYYVPNALNTFFLSFHSHGSIYFLPMRKLKLKRLVDVKYDLKYFEEMKIINHFL